VEARAIPPDRCGAAGTLYAAPGNSGASPSTPNSVALVVTATSMTWCVLQARSAVALVVDRAPRRRWSSGLSYSLRAAGIAVFGPSAGRRAAS
jgi:phosphoribosylamine-glycine ligase